MPAPAASVLYSGYVCRSDSTRAVHSMSSQCDEVLSISTVARSSTWQNSLSRSQNLMDGSRVLRSAVTNFGIAVYVTWCVWSGVSSPAARWVSSACSDRSITRRDTHKVVCKGVERANGERERMSDGMMGVGEGIACARGRAARAEEDKRRVGR